MPGTWTMKCVKDTRCPFVFVNGIPIFQCTCSILSMCHAGLAALKLTSVLCRCGGSGTLNTRWGSQPPMLLSVWTDWQVKRSRYLLSFCQYRKSKLHLWLEGQYSTQKEEQCSFTCFFCQIYLDFWWKKKANFFQLLSKIVVFISFFCVRFVRNAFRHLKTTLQICRTFVHIEFAEKIYQNERW